MAVTLVEQCLEPIEGLAALLRMLPAQLTELISQVPTDGDAANTYMQMFYVGLALDQGTFALEMQTHALARRRHYRIRGQAEPRVRLLAIMGPGNMLDNTPLDLLLENTRVRLDLLFVAPDEDLPQTFPDHDIVFIAIGVSDKHAELLHKVDSMLERWPRPVLNLPKHISNCNRDVCYERLKEIADLRIPRTWRYLPGQDLPFEFPLTIRPVDTHGGTGLARIEDAPALQRYLLNAPAPAYYMAQYIDYQSPDGNYRKIRIVLIDGLPYACHLAISDHWIVHYLSSGMHASPEKRAEEQQFMETFETGFAARHQKQLECIALQLGLDYVTIDCAELADGTLLVFEVDSRGLVHAQDSVTLYPYKPPVMQKAFDAFQAMLLRRTQESIAADT